MNIGNAVKTLRENKGYKQKEFASMINLSVNALCQIEKGFSFPQKGTLEKIYKALQITETYFLFFCIQDLEVFGMNRQKFNELKDEMGKILLRKEEDKSQLEKLLERLDREGQIEVITPGCEIENIPRPNMGYHHPKHKDDDWLHKPLK